MAMEKHILEEQMFANRQKKTWVAYLLLILLGGLGIHRFYLGLSTSGAIYVALFVIGFILPVTFLAIGVWYIVDIFLIPKLVDEANLNVRSDIKLEINSLTE